MNLARLVRNFQLSQFRVRAIKLKMRFHVEFEYAVSRPVKGITYVPPFLVSWPNLNVHMYACIRTVESSTPPGPNVGIIS